jgi:hypothetical protein
MSRRSSPAFNAEQRKPRLFGWYKRPTIFLGTVWSKNTLLVDRCATYARRSTRKAVKRLSDLSLAGGVKRRASGSPRVALRPLGRSVTLRHELLRDLDDEPEQRYPQVCRCDSARHVRERRNRDPGGRRRRDSDTTRLLAGTAAVAWSSRELIDVLEETT